MNFCKLFFQGGANVHEKGLVSMNPTPLGQTGSS